MKNKPLILIAFIIATLFGNNAYAQWTLVWADEFNGSIGSDWVFETGAGGWGNNELQYYRQENAYIQDNALVIEARNESYGGMSYTSARMKTQGRKSWGINTRVEARIQLPSFTGSWPAFWMLGDNITSVSWPACGEIDIMEHVNTEGVTYGTIHWQDHNNAYASYSGNIGVNVTQWHTYAVERDASAIRWYMDGNLYHEANIANNINGTGEFQNNFFILLNMAIGGNWPGFVIDNGALPAQMRVDWVRVYKQGGQPPLPNGVSGLGGTYTLQNRYSGKNLDVDDGQIGQDGANVQQWSATGGDNQKFQLIEVSSGIYRIMNVQSGKCVDISGVSNSNGANVHQWAYVGGSNQHFVAADAGGGYYKFVATHSSKLIEVGGFSTSDGGNVQQWEDAGQQTGHWRLNPANNNGGPLANGTYVIQNRYSGLYLDVDANTINQDGANVQQWQLYNTTNQKFTIANLGGDLYSIISVGSGKSLDVSGASTANGANIQQWTYVAVPQQQFKLVSVDGAYYKIIASHSNKLVEVGGFNTSNGGNIQQWEDAGQQTGHWQFFAAAKSTSSELTQKENYIIYPDPAANEIFIKGITSAATVEVFNTQGSLVLVKTDINESQSVNIEDLKQGLYVVLIKMESGEIQHLKFVKE